MPCAPTDFYARTAETLYRRLLYIRSLMPAGCRNNTELGGMCEQGVRDLLKDVLPARFGVGYGHISYGDDIPSGTKPLDVIIYDRLNYGPVYSEGDFVVVPPEATLALIEVKATLNKTAFERAYKQQIADAFVRIGMLPDNWSRLRNRAVPDCPGFVLGFSGAPEEVREYDARRISGPLVGCVDVERDWSRIKLSEWRSHETHGFAYWYWRLLDELYTRAAAPLGDDEIPAPVPRGYKEGVVFAEEDQFDENL